MSGDGKVLAPTATGGPCEIEQWFAGGWFRWQCVAVDHRASGEDRTQRGRDDALRRHAEYVERERAAGTMTGWTPVEQHRPALATVDVEEVRAWPGDVVRRYLRLGLPDVDGLTDRPAPQRAATPATIVAYIDRPAEALYDDDWWRAVAPVGAVLDVVDAATGSPGRPFRVVEAEPEHDRARLRIVVEG